MAGEVGLAEAVASLRSELEEAMKAGQDKDLRFGLGSVELELQAEVSTTYSGEAGAKLWVLSVGGEGSRTAARTHTVKLTLQPQTAAGGDVWVASEVEGEIG